MKSSHDLHKSLAGHYRHLDFTRRKIENLFDKGDIFLRDIKLMYSGIFIDAITSFENYIENLFVGLLCGQVQHRSVVAPVLKFPNKNVCLTFICGDRSYADWLPYSQTVKRAKKFFRNDGFPFLNLNTNDKKNIDEMITVRNVLAHNSQYSINKFRNMIRDLHLTSKESTPTGFLRSTISTIPHEIRYQRFVLQLSSIALKLS